MREANHVTDAALAPAPSEVTEPHCERENLFDLMDECDRCLEEARDCISTLQQSIRDSALLLKKLEESGLDGLIEEEEEEEEEVKR